MPFLVSSSLSLVLRLNVKSTNGVLSTNCTAHSGAKSIKVSSTLSEAAYLWQLISFPSSSYRFTFRFIGQGADNFNYVSLIKREPWLSGKIG